MRHYMMLFGLIAALGACDGGGGEGASATAAGSPVERAAAAAKAIQADPSKAAEALAAQGFTEAQFKDLLYEIAADPEQSAAYKAALTR